MLKNLNTDKANIAENVVFNVIPEEEKYRTQCKETRGQQS